MIDNVRYVKVNSLTVMESSSRKAKVLTTIKKKDVVTYLVKKTSWGKIKRLLALLAGLQIEIYLPQNQQSSSTRFV